MTYTHSIILRVFCLCALITSAPVILAEDAADAAEQDACVAKGMEPSWLQAGTDSARQMVRSCLLTSAPTADLCEKLPPAGVNDVMSLEAWYLKGCATLGRTSYHCQQLMDEVAEYCYANPQS